MRLQINKLGKVAVTVEQDYWTNTKEYDKLVIVEDKTLKTTFISRKEVPVGIDSSNREFWIPLGVTSGAADVTALYNKVNHIETYIRNLGDTLTSTINDLTKKVNHIESANTTEGIDSLNEIKAFLTGMLDTDNLSDKLETIDGEITSTYDESSGKLTLS